MELKPCPFCGGEASLHKEDGKVWIECDSCYCGTAFMVGFSTIQAKTESAVRDWERRTDNEESAELQEAICKYYAGKDSVIHIAEEIADLQIMLEQLAIIFDCKKCVKEWRKRKLERLEADK